jgi:hypothetical protein
MARFKCKCGNIISTTLYPNEIEIRAYTTKEWEKILENDTVETISIPAPENQVWRCPVCERLYVFPAVEENGRKFYSDIPSKVYRIEE